MGDEDRGVRIAAARALDEIKGPQHTKLLSKALADKKKHARLAVVKVSVRKIIDGKLAISDQWDC